MFAILTLHGLHNVDSCFAFATEARAWLCSGVVNPAQCFKTILIHFPFFSQRRDTGIDHMVSSALLLTLIRIIYDLTFL